MEQEAKKNNWLVDYRQSITSQDGEDGVIEKVFEVIGGTNKWCVEFGAGSGRKSNNTWNLIVNRGWSAVLIEAERALFQDLKKRYEENKRVACVLAAVAAEGRYALDNILRGTNIPVAFDFLSIDIDGHDYHVWEAVKNYEPRVVTIEINPDIPAGCDFVQPKDIMATGGSSLSAMSRLAQTKGYELVYTFGVNAIFVKKELFSKFGIVDNSLTALSSVSSSSCQFFQFYDGSIVLTGVDRRKILAYRKKIKDAPVWVFENGKLYPVRFTRDRRVARLVKNILKKTFFYSLFYPLVKEVCGWADFRRKKRIKRMI